VFARQVMGRPFLAPPGVPKERVAVLRKAFMETMKDPKFLAEAQKMNLEVTPVSGEKLQELVAELYRTPPEDRAQGGRSHGGQEALVARL
jgi:tripartite-type tricarboxylate transporter receptor subunit TctC